METRFTFVVVSELVDIIRCSTHRSPAVFGDYRVDGINSDVMSITFSKYMEIIFEKE